MSREDWGLALTIVACLVFMFLFLAPLVAGGSG